MYEPKPRSLMDRIQVDAWLVEAIEGNWRDDGAARDKVISMLTNIQHHSYHATEDQREGVAKLMAVHDQRQQERVLKPAIGREVALMEWCRQNQIPPATMYARVERGTLVATARKKGRRRRQMYCLEHDLQSIAKTIRARRDRGQRRGSRLVLPAALPSFEAPRQGFFSRVRALFQ